MTRAHTLGILALAYLAWAFTWSRVRLYRSRKAGPDLWLLARFDDRAVYAELEPVARRGFPDRPPAPAPHAKAPTAPPWYSESPWESAGIEQDMPLVASLVRGESPPLKTEAEASLGIHHTLRRLLSGDLEGAAALAKALPGVEGTKLDALVQLARAEQAREHGRAAESERFALQAQRLAERVSGSAAMLCLRVHVSLTWFTSALVPELTALPALRELRQALATHGDLPALHFAAAHAEALLGHQDESVDALGRALYYARNDPFYARAVLESPYVRSARPALAAQCRNEASALPDPTARQ